MIKILPKRTETAGRVPSSADLMEGEIAVNASDKIIFTKVSSGDVVNLTGAPMVHTHSISDVIGLQDDLESKVDKIPGKGLSDENFTTEEKSKLGTVEEGAEVNVATHLNQTRSGTEYTISSSTGSDTTLQPADGSFAGVMTNLDRIKLDGIESGAQVNVPTNLDQTRTTADYTITSSTGSDTTLAAATSGAAGVMIAADKSKLDGIEAGAQVNVPTNLSQSRTATEYTVVSSTGGNTSLKSATQSDSGVMSATDKTRLDSIHNSYNNSQWDTAYDWGDHAQAGYESLSNKGVANGYAGLGNDGKVPSAQLPSFVDDVLEYSSESSFPATGETGKMYVALDTNKVYRWSGSSYIYITSGAVDSVNGKTGVVVLSTSDVSEGSRQYFTTARARSSISASGDLSYNSSTGVVSFNETYSTPAEILSAVKSVDGAGSGLDADLLDGQSGEHYLNFSNFTNVPTYDNYGGWTLRTNGTSRGNVSSGESINIVGGSNIDVAYSSTNNTITLSSTDTNTDTNNYLNSLSFNTGNGILTAGMNGLGSRTVDLDGRYLLSGSKAADSDKLDGLNSSQFLRSDTDDTTTGTLTFNKAGALTVLNSTLVSSADAWHEIGNGTYGWKLKYVGSTSGTDGNEFRIESTSNTSKYFQIDHDGNVDISGNTVWHAGNFNPSNYITSSGTYANLRAQATTKSDVGLGSVRNVASYSQSEANGRFVNDTGDSMSGSLRINRADDGINDLQVGGDTAVDGDVNVGGVVNIGGGYEMAYNSSTKSLDFNFVG